MVRVGQRLPGAAPGGGDEELSMLLLSTRVGDCGADCGADCGPDMEALGLGIGILTEACDGGGSDFSETTAILPDSAIWRRELTLAYCPVSSSSTSGSVGADSAGS